jgi:transcriptional regulator with XRE-family HTH domain
MNSNVVQEGLGSGDRLRWLRALAGVRQYQLAQDCGVGRTRLSLAENGYVRLRPDEQEAVESALLRVIERRVADCRALLSGR